MDRTKNAGRYNIVHRYNSIGGLMRSPVPICAQK